MDKNLWTAVIVLSIVALVTVVVIFIIDRYDNFTSYAVVQKLQKPGKPPPSNLNLVWGGVPVNYRSTMDHTTEEEPTYLPVTNSMTAIKRLQAESNTPPWSDDSSESFDSKKGGDFINLYMQKKSKAADTFKPGLIKNHTALRHMNADDRAAD